MARLLSIVIVHWNTPQLLADCLASIERERHLRQEACELIVVDCASRDDAHRAVVASVPDARLIEMDENRGYAAGCNAGAGAASGEIILFLNADTVLESDSLGELARAFALAPHIGMVAPLLLHADGSVQSAGYRFPGVANALCDLLPVPGRLYESSLNGRYSPGDGCFPYAVDYPLGAALAIRRAAYDDVAGFDECYGMYSEEIDLARKLEARGWTRLVAPASRITHLGGASTGQMPDAMLAALWRSRGRYVRCWESRRSRAAVSAAVAFACALRATFSPPAEAARYRSIRAAFKEGLRWSP